MSHRPYRSNEDAQAAIEDLRAALLKAVHEHGPDTAEDVALARNLTAAQTDDARYRARAELHKVTRMAGESLSRAGTTAMVAKGHQQVTGNAERLCCGACGRAARVQRWGVRYYLLGEAARARCPGVAATREAVCLCPASSEYDPPCPRHGVLPIGRVGAA